MHKVQYKSAEFESIKISGNQIVLNFKFYKKDYFINTKNIKGFAIAGEDKVFYPAEVSIHNDNKSIMLHNKNVSKPVAARYGFEDCFESNMQTKSGLPISIFRTDKWPE